MKFDIQHLGLINHVIIDTKSLTIICGQNNTGKTYLTHSLYGVLAFLRKAKRYAINDNQKELLRNKGVCEIDLLEVASAYYRLLNPEERNKLAKEIPGLLGKGSLSSTPILNLEVSKDIIEDIQRRILDFRFDFPVQLHDEYKLHFSKDRGSSMVSCRYVPDVKMRQNIYVGVSLAVPDTVFADVDWVIYFLISQKVPRPFIIGSERTGVSVFRDEFALFRSIAFDDTKISDKLIELRKRFSFDSYPIAVRKDIEFSARFPLLVSTQDTDVYAKVKGLFEDIASGHFEVDGDTGKLYFIPNSSNDSLTLNESSSSVRALCELFFYVKYCARQGDILIVDEPELNLHPSSQRKIARLLIRLVNAGIRVLVTTHSEYIVREINAITRLNGLNEECKVDLLKRHGISLLDLINRAQVNCYVLKDGSADMMTPDSQYGFAVSSFDDAIRKLNALYDDLDDAECE